MNAQRDISFSICKAFAIIFVVLSHAGGPAWLSSFVFQFHVPVFFLCAGYFFKPTTLNDEKTFFLKRLRSLYFPFVRWSLFFLIIHNALFYTGLLNETYGNGAGGVLHPYNWPVFSQRVWNVVFGMSGYDEFLTGSYWFFRSLFVGSLGFFVLLKILHHYNRRKPIHHLVGAIVVLLWLTILWMLTSGLYVPGIAQGGYRELMGASLLGLGFLYRYFSERIKLNLQVLLCCLILLVVSTIYFPTSMAPHPTLLQFFTLPLTALAGFFLLRRLSLLLATRTGFLTRTLAYIGDHSLYVFAFHLVAFKLVSMLKVEVLGLPWEAVGGHPVVQAGAATDGFFLLYVLVGVAVPLLWNAGYKYLERTFHFNLSLSSLLNWDLSRQIAALVWLLLKGFGRGIYWLLRFIVLSVNRFFNGLISLGKGIIEASRPRDELPEGEEDEEEEEDDREDGGSNFGRDLFS